MIIKRDVGYAITKDVQLVINSANGLLFADSTGAGAIREASEDLSESERFDFDQLFSAAPKEIQDFFEKKREKHGWYYQHENLSNLKMLANNKYNSYEVGTAIFDPLWTLKDNPKKVIHAITLTYNPKTGERIIGTEDQIKSAIVEAIEIALDFGKKTIALPIACARPEYGLGPEKAYEIIMMALETFTDEDIEITLCFDNEQTADFLKTLN